MVFVFGVTYISPTNVYLRDVSGNVMAIYETINPSNTSPIDNIIVKEIPIYGSSRLGQYRPFKAPTEGQNTNKKTALGQRIYEFSNHLGNVLVTLTDNKVPQTDGTYKAIVLSASDYYPFGMAMKERTFANSEYRYGFNGQEQSNELDQNGNSYTAEFWQYDATIGRRWNLDPLKTAWESQYAAFRNNPVNLTDINGNCPNGDCDDVVLDGGVLSPVVVSPQTFWQKHSTALDGVQVALDIAGLIPGVGIIPDLINAGISFARGNIGEGLMSLVAAIPIVGIAAGAGKLISKGFKYGKQVFKSAKNSYKGYKAGKTLTKYGRKLYSEGIIELGQKRLSNDELAKLAGELPTGTEIALLYKKGKKGEKGSYIVKRGGISEGTVDLAGYTEKEGYKLIAHTHPPTAINPNTKAWYEPHEVNPNNPSILDKDLLRDHYPSQKKSTIIPDNRVGTPPFLFEPSPPRPILPLNLPIED